MIVGLGSEGRDKKKRGSLERERERREEGAKVRVSENENGRIQSCRDFGIILSERPLQEMAHSISPCLGTQSSTRATARDM